MIISQSCFYKNPEIKDQDQLFFGGISGSTDNAILGVFTESEEFNQYKAGYPALKGIDFQIDDNPILFYFQFNE